MHSGIYRLEVIPILRLNLSPMSDFDGALRGL